MQEVEQELWRIKNVYLGTIFLQHSTIDLCIRNDQFVVYVFNLRSTEHKHELSAVVLLLCNRYAIN